MWKCGKMWKPGNQGKRETCHNPAICDSLALSSASELAFQTGRRLAFVKKLSLYTSVWLKANNAMKRWTTEETMHSETRNSLVCSSWAWVFVWACSAKPAKCWSISTSVCLHQTQWIIQIIKEQRICSRTITDSGGWSETPRKQRKVVCRSFHY